MMKDMKKSTDYLFNCFFLVNYSVVSGGAALVFGSLVAGTGVFPPALAAIIGMLKIMIPLSYLKRLNMYFCFKITEL